MFAIGALLACIGLIVGIIAAIVVLSRGRVTERNGVLIAVAVCLIVGAFIFPQYKKAFSVPPIHNITTDVTDPPAFSAILPLRGDKSNPVDYDAAKLAPVQQQAYPWVKPLDTPLTPPEAFDRAVDVLNAMHIAIVDANKANGTIEGTATTFWFGFKDDIVVRIRPEGTGSRIDLHSVSRVGQGDSGVNAKRIGDFLTRFIG
jgi:uncharacterized protein (DUF1499 family)